VIFVDASAIVAILTREQDADALADLPKNNRTSLLFKGEDFAQTDIRSATLRQR
jgi:uncharacterized protein with PIN domain